MKNEKSIRKPRLGMKPIKAWAIVSPYGDTPLSHTVRDTRRESIRLFLKDYLSGNCDWETAKKYGFRAAKIQITEGWE